MAVELWIEKYRPTTFDDYVWKDPQIKEKIEEYVSQGSIPHLLLVGKAGTGKTSLAAAILNELKIPKGDILWIPASRHRNIEVIQQKIEGFISTWALGESGIKYVVMDEFDSVSLAAQKMLRTPMETFNETCRFILTANYLKNILEPVRSRCQEFVFSAIDLTDFTVKAAMVLNEENVEYDLDHLDSYIEVTYPDLRKCIGLLQKNVIGNKLRPKPVEAEISQDYILDMVNLFKQKKFLEARKLIVSQAQPEEYPDIYRFLYRNLQLFGDTEDKQDEALLIIREGLVNHTLVADIEINLAATLVKLGKNAAEGKT